MHAREVLPTAVPAALMTLHCLLLPKSNALWAAPTPRDRSHFWGRQRQGVRSHRWKDNLMLIAQLDGTAMPLQRCVAHTNTSAVYGCLP